jgi:hypothetical protein
MNAADPWVGASLGLQFCLSRLKVSDVSCDSVDLPVIKTEWDRKFLSR